LETPQTNSEGEMKMKKQKPIVKCLEGGAYILAYEIEGGNVLIVSFPNSAERGKYLDALDKDYLEVGNPTAFEIEVDIPTMTPRIVGITKIQRE
jgi:hypothetical protein